jgi:hypothetical protein
VTVKQKLIGPEKWRELGRDKSGLYKTLSALRKDGETMTRRIY